MVPVRRSHAARLHNRGRSQVWYASDGGREGAEPPERRISRSGRVGEGNPRAQVSDLDPRLDAILRRVPVGPWRREGRDAWMVWAGTVSGRGASTGRTRAPCDRSGGSPRSPGTTPPD